MLLVAVVLLVGALTFVPALALGPIVEHLMLYAAIEGKTMTRKKLPLFDKALLGTARSSIAFRKLARARRRATRSCSSSSSAAC